jgi:hypothetical protein
MPRINGTTNRMTQFLRSFRNPGGPTAADWPSPAIFRKWLRRPGFRAAFQSLQQALRAQSDFLLTAAANRAAVAAATQPQTPLSGADLTSLLRMATSHMTRLPEPEKPTLSVAEFRNLLLEHGMTQDNPGAARFHLELLGKPCRDRKRS